MGKKSRTDSWGFPDFGNLNLGSSSGSTSDDFGFFNFGFSDTKTPRKKSGNDFGIQPLMDSKSTTDKTKRKKTKRKTTKRKTTKRKTTTSSPFMIIRKSKKKYKSDAMTRKYEKEIGVPSHARKTIQNAQKLRSKKKTETLSKKRAMEIKTRYENAKAELQQERAQNKSKLSKGITQLRSKISKAKIKRQQNKIFYIIRVYKTNEPVRELKFDSLQRAEYEKSKYMSRGYIVIGPISRGIVTSDTRDD